MKIKTAIGKTALISTGIGLITIGYDLVKEDNLEVGIILVGLGIGCVLLGIILEDGE